MRDTIDYRAVYGIARRMLEGRRFTTLEALADRLARSILKSRKALRVRVRVTKLAPPLGVNMTAAVEAQRNAKEGR